MGDAGDRLVSALTPKLAALKVGPFTIGNRFAIQPMEGWDGKEDGKPVAMWHTFAVTFKLTD
jgi:2,4-dienoyl-CoA reductase-like NADH-dependent reductase (Old Yellow Enzyme family)